jgi:nicotinate-nucleotide adenylyltransferase
MAKNVVVFGGSFNPPHVAHVLGVAYVLATEPVDEILVVPCFMHPFAKELAPYEERFELCKAAMSFLPRVTVSRIEAELGGESRTLRTLSALAAEHPDWSMRLLIGADILIDAPKWHGFDEVQRLAPLLVLGRAGISREGAPSAVLPEVSSTKIRAALADGRLDDVRAFLPRDVLSRILERGLYGTPVPR